MKTDLSTFNNDWYKPGAPLLKRVCWYCLSAVFFTSRFPGNRFKIFLLRLFGAKIGKKVVVKPSVNIKSPWLLEVGDYSWIGEAVWIDNLVRVRIGRHACISQGAMLLTGNHNYKKTTFDLVTGEIIIEDGAWVGAKAIMCPGVTCGSHALLTVGSVATGRLEPYGIYRGNPAVKIRDRVIC